MDVVEGGHTHGSVRRTFAHESGAGIGQRKWSPVGPATPPHALNRVRGTDDVGSGVADGAHGRQTRHPYARDYRPSRADCGANPGGGGAMARGSAG